MENTSFADKFDALSKGANTADQKGEQIAKPLFQKLYEMTGGSMAATQHYIKQLGPQLKAMGSTDIVPLRVVDLPGDIATQYVNETRFHDFLSTKPVRAITDYQLKIVEEYIGNQFSSMINLDSTNLPANVQASFAQRFNTATVTGDTIQVSQMAQNINNLQGNFDINVLENQIAMEYIRIKCQENRTLLSNVEVVSEAAGQVPQLGGFLTRSTYGPISAAGGNFTNALLQQGVDQLRALYGSNVDLALFCTSAQLSIIRDLMINRFPGENSATHVQLMRDQLAAVGQSARGLMTNVVYQPYPGMAIPVYFDKDMPAGTACLFKADQPRLARMAWQGQGAGPFVAARPIASMFDLVLVFDIYSLHDPLVNSRVVYQSLAA